MELAVSPLNSLVARIKLSHYSQVVAKGLCQISMQFMFIFCGWAAGLMDKYYVFKARQSRALILIFINNHRKPHLRNIACHLSPTVWI
jgi:hypothetical protein